MFIVLYVVIIQINKSYNNGMSICYLAIIILPSYNIISYDCEKLLGKLLIISYFTILCPSLVSDDWPYLPNIISYEPVSREMHSDVSRRHIHSNNFGLKQLSTFV